MTEGFWRAQLHHEAFTGKLRVVTSLFAVLILLAGCGEDEPIRIGFVGELTGINATLGVQGRNGAQIAVDDINQRGGVNGRPLELVVRDDQASPEQVAAIDQELIDSGIFLLTGHLTSWESLNAKAVIDSSNAILISPTTSSTLFTGSRDTFFRLIPSNDQQGYALAEYAGKTLGLRRAAILHDEDNISFTDPLVEAFIERFRNLGGEETTHLHFSSKARPDFQPIVDALRQQDADLLLVIASAVDTALVAQHARMAGWQAPIFTSNWAYTRDLTRYGGSAAEGIIFPSNFNTQCEGHAYLKFDQTYRETYGEEPTFSAALSYETIQVAAAALKQTNGRREGLEQALIATQSFPGLCDSFSLDEYGDVQRNQYLFTIRDGAFQSIQAILTSQTP